MGRAGRHDDANLFVGVEKWRHGRFVEFEGAYGYGRDRVTTGWQRVALRTLDPALSTPWEPVAACTEPQPVTAGEVVRVDVALGPSATLVPRRREAAAGGRWALAVPAQPADRPDADGLCQLAARSRHPALGPALRRTPADPGNPLDRRADAKAPISARKWGLLRLLAGEVTLPTPTRLCRPRPRRRR